MRIERLVREIPDELLECNPVVDPVDEDDLFDRFLPDLVHEHKKCVELAKLARRLQEDLRNADP